MKSKERRVTEILAAHAERLTNSSAPPVELSPGEAAYVGPLMEIAERLKETLVPVEPPAAFVRSLGRELVEAARRRHAAAQRFRRGILIGAAALGSALSVAGVVTLVLLRRRTRFHPQPSPGPAGTAS